MRSVSAACLAATLIFASPSFAAGKSAPKASLDSAPKMSGLSVWGILSPYWGLGLGAGGRYMMPLGNKGLLDGQNTTIKDRFGLEFGADLMHYSYSYGLLGYSYSWSWTGFRPVVGALWGIQLTPELLIYPKLDLGFQFGFSSSTYTGTYGYSSFSGGGGNGIFFEGSAGLMYKLQNLQLRAEAGSSGLKIGAGFGF